MKNSSTNLTTALPDQMQYRQLAINYIGRVVKAREYCQRHKVGRIVSETTRQPVREQYRAYREKWSVEGVAKFLQKYQDNLVLMTTSETQIIELQKLIEKSKQYINN